MRERVNRDGRLPRRLAAFGLALWIGGVGCLFGCEMTVSAAGARDRHAAGQKESARATSHGCCHAAKKKKSGAAATVAASDISVRPAARADGAISQCPFSNPAIDPARKVRAEDTQALATVSPRALAPEVKTFAFNPPLKPLAPDRGGTYLRCCVFLI
ncbi:MAG: hypothetical protein LC785_06340 [Acidobacteria bacterium]|nr:hypothetical protein [Acidobacteriota bacterium]MCA1641563.1 hypothetical protein [Acidobacteriota bacterium]